MKKRIALKLICISIILTVFFQWNHVLAANFGVNIEFNGKTIEMQSETPEMEWNIEKLFPGETAEATLVINSVGSKEVKVELQVENEKKELDDFLTIKVQNNKTGKTDYDGKFAELSSITTKVPAKQTNTFKVTIGLPTEIESEIKDENIKIKFKLVAKGEKSSLNTNNQAQTATTENEQQTKNEISTDIIKPIKKQKSIVIYVVFAVMVCVLVGLIIAYFKTKN